MAAQAARNQAPDTLLLLEFLNVYTLGRSAHLENPLLSEEECARVGIPVGWVDRGGNITYHGPGQWAG